MQPAVPPDWPETRKRLMHDAFNDRLSNSIGRYKIWNTLVILVIGYCLAVSCQGAAFLNDWPWAQFLLGFAPAWLCVAALFSKHLHRRLFGLGAAFAGSLLIIGAWLLSLMGEMDRGRPFILLLMLVVLHIAVAGVITALRQTQLELRYWFERGPANAYEKEPAPPGWTASQCASQTVALALLFGLHLYIASHLPIGTIFVPSFFETAPGMLCTFTSMGLLLYGLRCPYRPLRLVAIGATGISALYTLWYAAWFWLPSGGELPTRALNLWIEQHGDSPLLRYLVVSLLAVISAATQPAALKQMRGALMQIQAARQAAGPLVKPEDEQIETQDWDLVQR